MKQIAQERYKLSSASDSVSKVNSLNRLGTLYRSRNVDSCFYYGMEARRIATDIRYQQGQADADLLVAYAFFKRGLYAESLELLGKTLSYYQQRNNTEQIIRVYLDMVEVQNKGISDRDEIVSLLNMAIQTGKRLKKDSIMSEVYMSYVNRGPDLAEDSIDYYLRKSTEIADSYNDERMLAYNQLWQVRVLILNGQKQEALPLVRQLIADAQRTGNPNQEINAHFLMVGYCDTDPKMALDHCYQAYEVSQKSGDRSLEIYILNNALEVAEHLGDKDEIIKVHEALEKSMAAEWEKSKKFISDYVRFNAIQDDNRLLSAENARRTLWLVAISFAASIIVLAIYLTMLRRNRKAKEQVEALNNAANMQIIAMEEAKHQAVKEEQQRLGQDLHDGLSSSIAAIRHTLEVLAVDSDDEVLKSKLTKLRSEVTHAYEVARNKSHDWFSATEGQEEQLFENRINALVDTALPDSRYQKTIHIDEGSLLRVDTNSRIILLRVIQEAITNIIKHARATRVDILIYEEIERLVMTVKDNGRGLGKQTDPRGKSAIGLNSIQRRVNLLAGEFDIRSGEEGTEIIVTMPFDYRHFDHANEHLNVSM
ncbi:sensor histidine kinase [Parapedobacter sp. 2B3]|uniref:sensor histidine kinase n=1 Tax=Parapedobacter sp. 2B3 TaxID=3342381 RepID=UPI0035B599DE